MTRVASGATPTGTVTFRDSVAGTLGTATLSSSGRAVLRTTFTSGSHLVAAVYAENGQDDGSSDTVTLQVS